MSNPLIRWSIASTLVLAGCGLGTPSEPYVPSSTLVDVPSSPSPVPTQDNAQLVRAIQQDVSRAYQAANTLTADFTDHQLKGGERYDATARLLFSKPRNVHIEIRECTDQLLAGATVVWTGGRTVKGKKMIGPVPIQQEKSLEEKPCLRGWPLNQTDYDAMMQSLLGGLPNSRVLGNMNVGGQTLVMVEFPARLSGVAVERIGIDPTLRLPVYRELRESQQGPAVFTIRYQNLSVNRSIPKNAFTL